MSYDFNDHIDEAMKRPAMESKCPVCQKGEMLHNRYAEHKVSCNARSCQFRCRTKYLPSITAAMELARALVIYEKEQTPLGVRKAGSDLNQARKRVIEVFGGE